MRLSDNHEHLCCRFFMLNKEHNTIVHAKNKLGEKKQAKQTNKQMYKNKKGPIRVSRIRR